MKMINNLFSSFDPSTNLNLPFNWIRSFIGFIIIPIIFWLIPRRINWLYNKILIFIHIEIKILLNPFNKGRTIIIISSFLIIIINNTIGLFPYIFTSTRQIVITLTLSITIWLTLIIFGWFTNTNKIFIHLVPQGTPPVLISFIVCIEIIRNLIRPGTLAIRLSANIIAGHLLLTLIGNTGNYLSNKLIFIILTIQTILLILEIAVAVIQSYVFTVLRTLYSREVI